MKDPKNIQRLNKIASSYITLHGLKGDVLGDTDPFAQYYTTLLMKKFMGFNTMYSNNGLNDPVEEFNQISEGIIVETNMFHQMIEKAYEFYKNVDNIENNLNPIIKEELGKIITADDLDKLTSGTIDLFKNSLFELLNNYNSNREEYNEIKIKVLEDKMFECAEIEDYEEAANIRDKIKELKNNL